MDLVFLSTVDSTSTHAAALVTQGKAAPFAVWAKTQTDGRGRRGNHWESPPGNLFLTLVLPRTGPGVVAPGCLSLQAGIIVARLIQNRLGVRLTLKWPNDLLFGGRKIGGILLESSISGQQMGPLLIGIGLNLNAAPPIHGPLPSTSLKDILGRAIDLESLVKGILADFQAHWDAFDPTDLPAAYEEFATGIGQLWCSEDGRGLASAGHLRADGALPLAPLERGKGLLLTTADHGWRWQHQGNGEGPLMVADVGNTAVKLAWYRAARDEQAAAVEAIELTALAPRLGTVLGQFRQHAPVSGWPLHILSVNPPAAARLGEQALAFGLTPLTITKRPVRRHGLGYVLADLGIDRLAAIEGLLARLAGKAPRDDEFVLVVGAGTATTIDAVRADGLHLGGLILPGLKTALASLHQATSLLPALDLVASATADGLGHDTRSAMSQAVIAMTLGAVERVVRGTQSNRQLMLRENGIYLTGGCGQILASSMGAVYLPELVMSGARVMVLGG